MKKFVLSLTFAAICAASTIGVSLRQELWRYTAIGDSLATGYTSTAGYVTLYRGHLQADNGVAVTLYNLGQNAATSHNLLNSLRTDAVFQTSVTQSEVVTWNIGLGDFRSARANYKKGRCGKGNRSDNQDCLRNMVTTFKTNWDAIMQEVLSRRGTADTIIRTMDIYNPSVLEDKAANTTPDSREPAASRGSDFQVLKYYLDQMNAHIAATAGSNLIPYAQVYASFNGPGGDEDPIAKGLIASDGLHPSDYGHQVTAELLRGLGHSPLR